MRLSYWFAAIALSGCANPRDEVGLGKSLPDGRLLAEVRRSAFEEGLPKAKEKLVAGLEARDGSRGDLERRVVGTTRDASLVLPDSLAALPPVRRARVAIAIVPGTKVVNPSGRDRTRECLRGAARVSREMGFMSEFIETESRGTVEENAAIVADRLGEVFDRSDAVILVMLSKGAHEVIRYLQTDGMNLPPQHRRKLVAVVSLAGTVQGAVVADWMAHSPRPIASMTRGWLRISGQEEAIAMLETIARSPWEPETASKISSRFPNLTWISVAMVPDGADGRITERLWAPMVRRRIERSAPYYSPNDGLVESAAAVLPDAVGLEEWIVVGLGSHALPNGVYRDGTRIAPRTTRPGREKLRPESGGEVLGAYLRALPQSLLR